MFWLALAGVVLAWFLYLRRPDIPARSSAASRFIYRLLDNKYYIDWFNENVLARAARSLGTGLWKGGDEGLIDGVFVNGSARAVGAVAGVVRRVQTGYLYWYAFAMLLGVIGLMTWQLWPCLQSCSTCSKPARTTMRLAEPCHLDADRAGVLLLAFGRDDQRARGALVRARRRAGELPGDDPARHRLRHRHRGACSSSRSAPGSSASTSIYHLGVDGISFWFVLLTAFITVIVVIVGWEVITERVNQYMAAFLILSGLMIGVFCALDGLLFYIFFEATLIPMYLIIGIWGGPQRVYAAFKFFLYTLLGSLLMLVALVYLYTKSGGSFDILDLAQAAAVDGGADAAVLRLLRRLRGQGADVAGAHLAAGRARRGAHRRLRRAGRDHAEARRLRLPALLAADRARRQRTSGPG